MAIARAGLSGRLAQFLRDQGWRNDATAEGSAQLVCLRGCAIGADGSLSAKGSPTAYTDHYDDVMIVFGKKPGGAPYLECFRASAKPGLASIHHPDYASSSKGCPTVQPGQYKYVRGRHLSHPEALRQANGAPVCVIRDLNDNAQLELSDRVDYPIYTGINIHAGGTGSKVGLNSMGCQVIHGGWTGAPWTTFHDLVYRVAKQQALFHYTLADFPVFAAWHDAPAAERPTSLLFGSCGAPVKKLQEALAAAGYYGSKLVDGEFGRVTDEGLRAYQKSVHLPPDGIAGAAVRKQLGLE